MILVTGGSGHLGANLVRRLLADGEEVRVLVRRGSANVALEGLDVQRVWGDLRDAPAVEAAVRGCDRVHHCAATISTLGGGEREIWDTNVQGTQNLLRAAREAGVERVVVTSSLSAVGHVQGRPSDETMPVYPFDDLMPYELTKSLVELECLRAVADGLDVVIAAASAIVGPHDYQPSRMGRTLLDYERGHMPAYIEGGFEFVSTRDMTEAHVLCMERGRAGQRYLFSTEYMSVGRLLDLFAEVTGKRRRLLRLPAPLMYGVASVTSPLLARFLPNVPQRLTPGAVKLLTSGRRADITKARRELGFRPTTVGEAIREAYGDFARRGLVRHPRGPIVVPTFARTSAPTASPGGDTPPVIDPVASAAAPSTASPIATSAPETVPGPVAAPARRATSRTGASA